MSKTTALNATCELRLRELRAPRYTSYPTALSMETGFDVDAVNDELARNLSSPSPTELSLYVHIPFCASACYYCGCNRVISRQQQRHQDYLDSLTLEIERYSKQVHSGNIVRQIHFGGGTPNLLPPESLATIVNTLRDHYNVADNAECSIEIDPRQAKVSDVTEWRKIGFNRMSIGVQDVDSNVQLAINRPQSSNHIQQLLAAAREQGFSGINLDLIIGLPQQTAERFQKSLEQVVDWQPDRVALYQYAHMPSHFPAQRAIKTEELPSVEQRFAMQARAREAFDAAGYQHIGMDHFALPSDSLATAQRNGLLRRNFQGYSVISDGDLLGFGVSAISQIGVAMVQNNRDLAEYEKQINARQSAWAKGLIRTEDDQQRSSIIQELMCTGQTERADPQQFSDAWAKLEQLDSGQRWVKLSQSQWVVTNEGHDYIRLIAQCFDQHTPSKPASNQSITTKTGCAAAA